jgi:hypothetical protein
MREGQRGVVPHLSRFVWSYICLSCCDSQRMCRMAGFLESCKFDQDGTSTLVVGACEICHGLRVKKWEDDDIFYMLPEKEEGAVVAFLYHHRPFQFCCARYYSILYR